MSAKAPATSPRLLTKAWKCKYAVNSLGAKVFPYKQEVHFEPATAHNSADAHPHVAICLDHY